MDEFAVVEQEISVRFAGLRAFWADVKVLATPPPAPQSYGHSAGRGFTIVFLYGALEYGLTRSVRQLSELIYDYAVRRSDISSPLMCLVHEPTVKAVNSAGKRTRIQTRLRLFDAIHSTEYAVVHDELIAPELQNVWTKSIQDTFSVFGISQAAVFYQSSSDYIDRIVNDRNAVAHGREAPDVVGARYTVHEIDMLIERLEAESRYFIGCFRSFYQNREFVNSRHRHRYLKRDMKISN